MPKKKIDEHRLLVRMTKNENRQMGERARAAGIKSKSRFMVLSSLNVALDLSPSARAWREQAGMDLNGAARNLNQLLKRMHGGQPVLEDQILDTLAAVEHAAMAINRAYRTEEGRSDDRGAGAGVLEIPTLERNGALTDGR